MQCLRGKRVRRMGLNSFEVIYAAVDSAVDDDVRELLR